MTTFSPGSGSSFPSDATELSKAAIWLFSYLESLQPKATYNVFTGKPPEPLAATSIFKTRNHGCRFVGSAWIALNPTWKTDEGKLWTKILPGFLLDSNSPSGATETFNPGTGGSVPSNVDKVQKAIIWMGQAWEQCNGSESIIETEYDPTTGLGGQYIPIAVCEVYNTADHGYLCLCRVSVPISPDWASTTGYNYQKGLVSSNTALGTTITTA